MQILFDIACEKPPAQDRLTAMIRALASGAEIGEALRTEIIDALKTVCVRQANDKTRSTKGSSFAIHTFQAAALAKHLIDDHGVTPKKAAIGAAFESVQDRTGFRSKHFTAQAVGRRYREIKDSPDCSMKLPGGDKYVLAHISVGFVDDAIQRLPVSAKRCNSDIRIPEPTFVITVAHLFNPAKAETNTP